MSLLPRNPRPSSASAVASPTARPARSRRARQRGEGGQALVEFAIVVPVLLLVVFGIIRFGVLYNNYIEVTNAVDAGARQFSIERDQADPCSDTAGVVVSAAAGLNSSSLTMVLAAQDLATSGQVNETVTSSTAAASCDWSSADTGVSSTGGTLVSGTPETVTATYPWNLSFLGLKIVSSTFSVSATEDVE